MSRNIVIGAGPAGIGVGLSLGKDCKILERANTVGGFSRSIEIKGAIFDFGGHSFHTPHPEVRDLVYNSLEMYQQTRNAKCFSKGQVIPYPFQKNFRALNDQSIVKDCLEGLDNLPTSVNKKDFDNFEDFIFKSFGPGISKHFMLPYNKKLWGRDLTRMAADWTSERVAAPEGIKEKFDLTGGKRKPLQADTKVGYPAKGGFGEIYKAIGKKLDNVEYNTSVTKVDSNAKKVYASDGKSHSYENLISSIAILDFLKMMDNVPQRIWDLTERLDYLSMVLGLVVINHPVDTDIQRFYSAEREIISHKTAINHNSSDYLRSLPHHGIMMEISEGPEKTLHRSDTKQWIVDSLLTLGAIKHPHEIEEIQIQNVKYSYPVPTKDRNEIMKEIKDWLQENDIYTVGRFGEWAYINSDKAIFRGLELGKYVASL
ncbi:protoporphyrinogen/coproporphyrinogen oxidase [Aureibaculum conchae]|uniref:protoporphyrinogen/coproporphyrinogen oxidase n=1 Tax=Aureibaculum sp. 2308TA14-22 TaxID=3108392 RepID=UPI0033986D03